MSQYYILLFIHIMLNVAKVLSTQLSSERIFNFLLPDAINNGVVY